jgi:hypothetical protein
MESSMRLALVVLAALLGVQSQAAANGIKVPPSPIPAVSGSMLQGACSVGGTCIPGGANIPPAGTTITDSGVAFVSGTVTLSPYPTISAILDGANKSFVDVSLSYGFEVVDPFAPVGFTAPISVQFSTSADVVGPAADDDYATLAIYTANSLLNGIPIFTAEAGTPGSGAHASSFSVSKDFTGLHSLISNTAYVVSMEVFLQSNSLNSNIVATGYVDPIITIDPGQFDSAGLPEFDLELSPGVSNTPLPSTWVMMLSGLLGLGLFAYRGGKKDRAAVSVI